MKKFLEQHYPELDGKIDGAHYPPPPYTETLVSLAALAQMSVVVLLLFAKPITRSLGYTQTPPFVQQLQENQMQIFITLFILSSFVQNLKNTGAFEIHVNGKTIFSKLDTGRMPSIGEIVNLLEDAGLKTPVSVRSMLKQHI